MIAIRWLRWRRVVLLRASAIRPCCCGRGVPLSGLPSRLGVVWVCHAAVPPVFRRISSASSRSGPPRRHSFRRTRTGTVGVWPRSRRCLAAAAQASTAPSVSGTCTAQPHVQGSRHPQSRGRQRAAACPRRSNCFAQSPRRRVCAVTSRGVVGATTGSGPLPVGRIFFVVTQLHRACGHAGRGHS